MLKTLFVINPKSGNREGGNLESIISEQSRVQGFEFLIYRLLSSNEEKNVRKEIASYSPDVVAVAGGDGTVNLLAKILSATKIPMLIIPMGSANGMAKELGIGNKVDYALSLLGTGRTRDIDLLNINGNLCVHLGDIGLNASIVKRFEMDPNRGLWTYAKHLFKELFLIDHHRYTIECDGAPAFKRNAVSLTFANASKYGTGAVINPIGKLDDGKFELVIIKPFARIHLISITWKMFLGTLQTSEFVEVISCKKVLVKMSHKTTLQVDGEIKERTKEISVEIQPNTLSVIVPSEQ